MSAQLTVDDTNKQLVIEFLDDKGDTDAAPPASNDGNPLVVNFTSTDPSVCGVAADPSNPLVGALTVGNEGECQLGAEIQNGDGSQVMEPDGSTPFTVTPVDVTVGAGQAVSATATVE